MAMEFEEFVKKLEEQSGLLEGRLRSVAKQATMRAVEKATDMTPPFEDDGKSKSKSKGKGDNDLTGTDTRTAGLKQSWATDSRATPTIEGDEYVTELRNDKEYASYVNDGHWMDRHFVPGLIINPESDLLEYIPGAKVGLVVGTKTARVDGIFMVEAASETYEEVAQQLLHDMVVDLYNDFQS